MFSVCAYCNAGGWRAVLPSLARTPLTPSTHPPLPCSNPVNSTVPICAEVLKKAGVYNPRKVGSMTPALGGIGVSSRRLF